MALRSIKLYFVILVSCVAIYLFLSWPNQYVLYFRNWRLYLMKQLTFDKTYCLYEAGIRGSRIKVLSQPISWENLTKRYVSPLRDLRFKLAANGNEYTPNPVFYKFHQDHNVWEPEDCHSNYSIALIVPFRDREQHLVTFLNHMHAFLRQQNVSYQIFVIEQVGVAKFNRGMVLNIGFIEASQVRPFDCYILHDVDLLPEDTRNLYRCSSQPIHLTRAIDKFDYKLPYNQYFGGAIAVTKQQYEDINGFSNVYFGWGAEDDDIFRRFMHKNYRIKRYENEIARYTSLKHKRDKTNPENEERSSVSSDTSPK